MDKKPKVRGNKSKVGRDTDKRSQAERFIETARSIGVDESGKEFERALTKITQRKVKR